MRNITKALIVLMLLVPQAQSRVTILPSDNTGGRDGTKLGLTWMLNDTTPWLTANLPGCLATINTQPISFCDTAAAAGTAAYFRRAYSGRPTVTELVCNTSSPLTGTSTVTIRLAFRNETAASFEHFAGSVVFDASTPAGKSVSLPINLPPDLADGFFLVTVNSVVQDGGDAFDLRVACTVN